MIVHEKHNNKNKWEYTLYSGSFRNSPITGTLSSPKRKSIRDLMEWANTTNLKIIIDSATGLLYGYPHETESKAPNYKWHLNYEQK